MSGFRSLLRMADEQGELRRIGRSVGRDFELSALMQQIDQRREAYYFDDVEGARFPLAGGLLNDIKRYGWALDVVPGEEFSRDDLSLRIEAAKANTLPPRSADDARVKENILTGNDIRLTELLPVPTFFELDTGPFITAACGISRNPHTGNLNVGIYRVLVLGPDRIAVNASATSDLASFQRHAKEQGIPLPIALAIGVDPALMIAATCKIPVEISEYDVAGALAGEPIEVVRCETSDLLVPANAEIVIEGQVDPSCSVENLMGEFAGQYGAGDAVVAELKAFTHRSDAVYYSIMAGMNPEHNTLAGLAALDIENALLKAVREQVPAIEDMCVYLEPGYGSMAHIVVSIDKQDDAEPMQVIGEIFDASGGFFPVSEICKRVVVVDSDIDVHSMADVEWAIWTRLVDASKYRVVPDVRSWELERGAKGDRGSLRLWVDATMDMGDRPNLVRPAIPGADRIRLDDYIKQPEGDEGEQD